MSAPMSESPEPKTLRERVAEAIYDRSDVPGDEASRAAVAALLVVADWLNEQTEPIREMDKPAWWAVAADLRREATP